MITKNLGTMPGERMSFSTRSSLTLEEAQAVYRWLHQFELSKQVRKINRDFSDGVLVAEILKSILPRCVELHNYVKSSAVARKMENWHTLNRKVLRRLEIFLRKETIQDLANSCPGIVEALLYEIMVKTERQGETAVILNHISAV